MARYRVKRKLYGIGEAAQNTIGGVTEGVGKVLDNKAAGLVGAGVGAGALGGTIGTALGGLGLAASGPIGWLAGAGLGYAATRGLGKGLKNAGDNLQS